MMSVVVGVAVYGMVVEVGRMYHVSVCVGQAGKVGVVGYWVCRGLAVHLTEILSNGRKEGQ